MYRFEIIFFLLTFKRWFDIDLEILTSWIRISIRSMRIRFTGYIYIYIYRFQSFSVEDPNQTTGFLIIYVRSALTKGLPTHIRYISLSLEFNNFGNNLIGIWYMSHDHDNLPPGFCSEPSLGWGDLPWFWSQQPYAELKQKGEIKIC